MATKQLNFAIGLGTKDNGFTSGLLKANSALRDVAMRFRGAFSFAAIGAGFAKSVSTFTDMGLSIGRFSDASGIAAADVSALGGALEKFGGNIDTAKATLGGLQSGLEQAKFGTGSLMEAMRMYGVSLFNNDGKMMNTKELLLSLSDQFKRFPKSRQMELAKVMGLDESTILLLQEGRSAVQQMLAEQQRMGAITAKDTLLAKQWNSALVKTGQNFKAIGLELARLLMPALVKFSGALAKTAEFLRENDRILYFFGTTLTLVALPAIVKFGLGFIAAMAPVMLFVAAIALVALVAEDIYGYFHGKDSLLGPWLKDHPKIEAMLKGVVQLIDDIKDGKIGLGDIWDYFLEGIKWSANEIKNTLGRVFEDVGIAAKSLGKFLIEGVNDAWGEITAKFKRLAAFFVNPIVEFLNGIKNPFTGKSLFELSGIYTRDTPPKKEGAKPSFMDSPSLIAQIGAKQPLALPQYKLPFADMGQMPIVQNPQSLPVINNSTSAIHNSKTSANNVTLNQTIDMRGADKVNVGGVMNAAKAGAESGFSAAYAYSVD